MRQYFAYLWEADDKADHRPNRNRRRKPQDHVTVDMTVRFHDGEASFSCNHNCDAGDVEVAVSRATVSLDEFDTVCR